MIVDQATVNAQAQTDPARKHPQTRLVMSPGVNYRSAGGGMMQAQFTDRIVALPVELYRLILCFSEASTIGEVYDRVAADDSFEAVAEVVGGLADEGFLAVEGGNPGEAPSAPAELFPLRRDVTDDAELLNRLQQLLREDRACIIERAFPSELAEAAFTSLDEHREWSPYEGYHGFFHYRHHNMYRREAFPPIMRTLARAFSSPATKQFIGRLSGRDCGGETEFSASYYLPGDYSLPHNDCGRSREVAFVWYLTKRWRPEWGGQLFWAATQSSIVPTFNSLVVFPVTPRNYHNVCVVAPQAGEKRMAINGWWCSVGAASESESRPPLGSHAWIQGGEPRELHRGLYVL